MLPQNVTCCHKMSTSYTSTLYQLLTNIKKFLYINHCIMLIIVCGVLRQRASSAIVWSFTSAGATIRLITSVNVHIMWAQNVQNVCFNIYCLLVNFTYTVCWSTQGVTHTIITAPEWCTKCVVRHMLSVGQLYIYCLLVNSRRYTYHYYY